MLKKFDFRAWIAVESGVVTKSLKHVCQEFTYMFIEIMYTVVYATPLRTLRPCIYNVYVMYVIVQLGELLMITVEASTV